MIPNGKITFPPYEPDKAPYNVSASNVALNGLPTADGWGAMPDFVEVSEALPAVCLGSIGARDTLGNFHIFAGTSDNLFKLNTTSTPYTWDEISKSTDAYSLPSGDRWSSVQYGNSVYFAGLGDTIQSYDLSSSSDFADLSNAPTCRYLSVFGDFLVALHLDSNPDLAQWCGVNAPTQWTIGLRGADQQSMPGGLGEIMGAIGDPRGGVIIQRNAMQYMQFAPSSGFTFQRSTANPARGTMSPFSIAQYGPNQFAYLSEDGFFANVNGTPIGAERVDKTFLADLDEDYINDVQAAVDPFRTIIWWRYFSVDATYKLIGWNWNLNRWCHSDQQLQEARGLTKAAVPWDGLDALYATIDDAVVPFDSRLFQAGAPTFAAFTTDNKLAFATGGNKALTLETGAKEFRPGRRTFVNGCKLQGDASDFTIQAGIKQHHGDGTTWLTAVNPETSDLFVPIEAEGALHQMRLNVAAGADWTVASNILVQHNDGGEI